MSWDKIPLGNCLLGLSSFGHFLQHLTFLGNIQLTLALMINASLFLIRFFSISVNIASQYYSIKYYNNNNKIRTGPHSFLLIGPQNKTLACDWSVNLTLTLRDMAAGEAGHGPKAEQEVVQHAELSAHM